MIQFKQNKFQNKEKLVLRSIYVLNSDFENHEFKQNLFEHLGKIYKNIVTFFPISDDNVNICNTVLTKTEAIEQIGNGNKNILLKNMIAKFDSIKADFIIVVGGFIDILDDEIAKNLNSPFLLSKQSKFKSKIFKFDVLSSVEDIFTKTSTAITPLRFEMSLYQRAAKNIKTVVLPESDDERVLKAAAILLKSGSVKLILLGNKDEINDKANSLGLDLGGIRIIDHSYNEFSEDFAKTLFELRKEKGMELATAKELMKDRTYFGTMLVYKNIANAMVSGASTTTAETIRPALQFIKMKPGVKSVSGSFIMCLDTQIQLFADCAITPNPTTDQLAGVALSTAKTAKDFGLEPKVAMLSYATGDSAKGDDIEFVAEATNKVRQLDPSLAVDGPIQFDAAVDPKVAAKKLPGSKVAGQANTFVFPNLNCGNICYKAVQRSADALAIGPILQGLNKPVNDLSRGCSVEDIVNTVLISAIQGE